MSSYDKTAIERSRQMLQRREVGGVPLGCHRCAIEFVKRCEKLPPDEEVLCELSDIEVGIKKQEKVRDTKFTTEHEEQGFYYLNGHVWLP
jgi:hypothetical protein